MIKSGDLLPDGGLVIAMDVEQSHATVLIRDTLVEYVYGPNPMTIGGLFTEGDTWHEGSMLDEELKQLGNQLARLMYRSE